MATVSKACAYCRINATDQSLGGKTELKPPVQRVNSQMQLVVLGKEYVRQQLPRPLYNCFADFSGCGDREVHLLGRDALGIWFSPGQSSQKLARDVLKQRNNVL